MSEAGLMGFLSDVNLIGALSEAGLLRTLSKGSLMGILVEAGLIFYEGPVQF